MKTLIAGIIMSVMVMGCSVKMSNEKLSLDHIKEIDACHQAVGRAIGMGIVEHPGQDYLDEFNAYYYAMNVAWAYGDEDDYDEFHEILLDQCETTIEEAELPVPAPTTVPGQDL